MRGETSTPASNVPRAHLADAVHAVRAAVRHAVLVRQDGGLRRVRADEEGVREPEEGVPRDEHEEAEMPSTQMKGPATLLRRRTDPRPANESRPLRGWGANVH